MTGAQTFPLRRKDAWRTRLVCAEPRSFRAVVAERQVVGRRAFVSEGERTYGVCRGEKHVTGRRVSNVWTRLDLSTR